MSNCRIYEQGNGLPAEGDYCAGHGQLWLVESIDSRIQTGDPAGNYVYATVSEADWEDCPEDEEHTARVAMRSARDGEPADAAACADEERYEQQQEEDRLAERGIG